MENSKMLVAIYARVSTSKQEEDGTVENQITRLKEYAKSKGHVIVREYVDNGWSGERIDRPELDRLREDAKKKIWQAVLIYDPDRLARLYWFQEYVMNELREAGIEVIFMTRNAPKDESEKIMYGFQGLFAEYERAKIADRTRQGKLRKVKDGHIMVSQPLYGYDYVPKHKNSNGEKEHGYYKINESEAGVVRQIFSFVGDQGMTLRALVRKLDAMGIKPKHSKRGVWNTSTLSTMLRNKAYIGKARWGSSYAVAPENPVNNQEYRRIKKSSRRIKPEQDWIASAIPVPVIIDEALFTKVGEQLKTNYALCQRNAKNEYLLSGKIRCVCGRTRAGEGPKHGKYLYYRCSDRVLSYPLPPNCHEKGINARIADELVWQRVFELMGKPELMLTQAERWLNAERVNVQLSNRTTGQIQAEIDKQKKQINLFSNAYGAEALTLDQFKELTTPTNAKIADLELELAKVKQEENQIKTLSVPNRDEIEAFADKATQALASLNFKAKKAIMACVLEKIIGTQKELHVSGYIPITPNSYVEFLPNDRHRRPA